MCLPRDEPCERMSAGVGSDHMKLQRTELVSKCQRCMFAICDVIVFRYGRQTQQRQCGRLCGTVLLEQSERSRRTAARRFASRSISDRRRGFELQRVRSRSQASCGSRRSHRKSQRTIPTLLPAAEDSPASKWPGRGRLGRRHKRDAGHNYGGEHGLSRCGGQAKKRLFTADTSRSETQLQPDR